MDRTRVLTIALAMGVAVAFADSSIVVLALPDLYSEFDTTLVGVSWVISSYNLVVAVAALLLVPFARRLRPRPTGIVGVALFAVGSAGCAAAWSLDVLIGFRCLQALGGTLLLAASLRGLAALTGSPVRAAVVWTLAGTIGAAAGPALGGVLTQLFDWRAIFVVQVPLALVALASMTDVRVRDLAPEPRERTARPHALAADAGLGLVFGALVGALFLSVLLVITVWSLDPVVGALVVSALPAATLAVRPLARQLDTRTAALGGAALLAGGLVALALLPRISNVLVALALAFCGAGLGLAVPAMTGVALDPQGRATRSVLMTVGARHAGLVLALALIAPLLSETLSGSDDKALLAGAQVVLEGNADLRQKVPIALDLRDALDEAKKGEIPDLARPFDERGAATDSGLRDMRDDLIIDAGERGHARFPVVVRPLRLARPVRSDPGLAAEEGRMRPLRVLAALLAAVGVLIVVELGMGALDFGETRIANACTTEADFEGGGIDGAIQRFALAAISGAACELGTSREELVLSFVPSANASDVRWDKETINRALRAGVEKAAEDTAGEGLLGSLLAGLLDEILADPLAWILGQSVEG